MDNIRNMCIHISKFQRRLIILIMHKLEVVKVCKKYKKKEVLRDVSFSLGQGDVLGIIGENGAGKSTLMSILVTLIKPESGDVLFEGCSVVEKPNIVRGNIGYVPQDIALYEDLTGFENLKFWMKTYHAKPKDFKEQLDSIIKIMDLSEKELNSKVRTYSGGMKRRINIGVALLNNPDIIVMDEPTVGIDISSKQYILDVIRVLKKQGRTIIYSSHYMDEIEYICDKICLLSKGQVVDFTTLENIISDNSPYNNLIEYYLNKSKEVH